MKPHIPETLPLKSLEWTNFIRQLGEANRELARYDGILRGIPNPTVFLSPLTTQEAVLSSRIEGTQATLEEVLGYEALPNKDIAKEQDILEIINYRRSLGYAVNYLKKKPISLNLIKDIHDRLLDSVRGRNKGRGQFRTTQNFIGRQGTSIEQASYIPPPPENIQELLSNLEKYIHSDEKDPLVQLAIVHAQFEIIHPFSDGNGRVGRILIPLFLVEKKLLSSPVFYISAYLEVNRDTYIDRLNGITRTNNWEGWITFFLAAVAEQAKINSANAIQILQLYDSMKKQVSDITRSQHAIKVLDAIFQNPIFNSSQFVEETGIPRASAKRLLLELRQNKILTLVKDAAGKQPAVLQFSKLLEIVG
jgi:Fic family protein